jgi:hypothetical protein
VQEKMEEYNSIKENSKNIICECFAIYELSVKNDIQQFIYLTDYETEKEAIEYIERLCNLTVCDRNSFVIRSVKKNACGDIM